MLRFLETTYNAVPSNAKNTHVPNIVPNNDDEIIGAIVAPRIAKALRKTTIFPSYLFEFDIKGIN